MHPSALQQWRIIRTRPIRYGNSTILTLTGTIYYHPVTVRGSNRPCRLPEACRSAAPQHRSTAAPANGTPSAAMVVRLIHGLVVVAAAITAGTAVQPEQTSSSLPPALFPTASPSVASLIIPMATGWTWFSINIRRESEDLNTMLSSILPAQGDTIKNQRSFATFYTVPAHKRHAWGLACHRPPVF